MLLRLVGLGVPFGIAYASEWFLPNQELSSAAEDLVETYVEWHAKAGAKKGTRLLVLQPINGLGDQMINFVQNMLHYCVTMPGPAKERLRFEITPGAFDEFTPDIKGVADNLGVWGAGINARINLTHDPQRAKALNHKIVETMNTPCWPGQCKYHRHDNRINPIQVLYAVLLWPSEPTKALMRQTLPSRQPELFIGVHLRTWVMDPSPQFRQTDEMLAQHVRPMFEFELARSLYDAVVSATAECVLDAVRASSNKASVFVTSDYIVFTRHVVSYLQEKRPGLEVSYMPGKPVWSHRVYDTDAGEKDYENVWATWFTMSQTDHLCIGNSMFTESAQLLRWQKHPEVSYHGNCLGFAWVVLNEFTRLLKGQPGDLQTFRLAVRHAGSRSIKDTTCFPDALKLQLLDGEL